MGGSHPSEAGIGIQLIQGSGMFFELSGWLNFGGLNKGDIWGFPYGFMDEYGFISG